VGASAIVFPPPEFQDAAGELVPALAGLLDERLPFMVWLARR
jgi:hypothetical protein